jgi:tRNA 2-thiouridine synthesizing protein A
MAQEPMPESNVILDAGETACGELILLIFQKMKTLRPGQILEVIGFDPGAQVDVPAWCRQTGNALLSFTAGSPAHFIIRKKEN